jgi:hypothetical protein
MNPGSSSDRFATDSIFDIFGVPLTRTNRYRKMLPNSAPAPGGPTEQPTDMAT